MRQNSNRLALSERITSGDIVDLQFKALEVDGAAINLSAFTEIELKMFALGPGGTPTDEAVYENTLAEEEEEGTIELVGGGTTGLFKCPLLEADTEDLVGVYWVQVQLTDAASKVRTCRPFILAIDADLV